MFHRRIFRERRIGHLNIVQPPGSRFFERHEVSVFEPFDVICSLEACVAVAATDPQSFYVVMDLQLLLLGLDRFEEVAPLLYFLLPLVELLVIFQQGRF